MRKSIVAVIIALVVSVAIVSEGLVNSVLANPYSHIFPIHSGEVAPHPDTQPPKITISSPDQNSTFNTNSLSIRFKVEVGESKSAYSSMIWNVYYEADWQENRSPIYEYGANSSQQPNPIETEYSTILNLTEIPEGRLNLRFLNGQCGHLISRLSLLVSK